MQVALISPELFLEHMPNTGLHLVLAPLLRRNLYRGFYYAVSGYKILDNGAAEGELVKPRKLLTLAHSIKVDEVVVPDVMTKCEETMELVRSFEKYARQYPEFKYQAVVQGTHYSEWWKCLNFYLEQDWIDVVAFPRCMNNGERTTRVSFLSDAFQEGALPKSVHILGASRWVEEVKAFAIMGRHGQIRSMDTSLPVVMGIAGCTLDYDYVSRQTDYFDTNPANVDMEVIQKNVRTYLKWAKAS